MINDQNLKPVFLEYAAACFKGGFVLDEENTSQMQSLFKIFRSSNVGLLVAGNPGSGKTVPFDILIRILHPKDIKRFRIVSCRTIEKDYSLNGSACLTSYIGRSCLFDDLGSEENGRFFANPKNVMQDIIQMAYDNWRAVGTRYHFTTNLSHTMLKERYEARCFGRLMEMAEEIRIGDKKNYTNRRELKNFLGWKTMNHPARRDEWESSSSTNHLVKSGEVKTISEILLTIDKNANPKNHNDGLQ